MCYGVFNNVHLFQKYKRNPNSNASSVTNVYCLEKSKNRAFSYLILYSNDDCLCTAPFC